MRRQLIARTKLIKVSLNLGVSIKRSLSARARLSDQYRLSELESNTLNCHVYRTNGEHLLQGSNNPGN